VFDDPIGDPANNWKSDMAQVVSHGPDGFKNTASYVAKLTTGDRATKLAYLAEVLAMATLNYTAASDPLTIEKPPKGDVGQWAGAISHIRTVIEQLENDKQSEPAKQTVAPVKTGGAAQMDVNGVQLNPGDHVIYDGLGGYVYEGPHQGPGLGHFAKLMGIQSAKALHKIEKSTPAPLTSHFPLASPVPSAVVVAEEKTALSDTELSYFSQALHIGDAQWVWLSPTAKKFQWMKVPDFQQFRLLAIKHKNTAVLQPLYQAALTNPGLPAWFKRAEQLKQDLKSLGYTT